VSPATWPRDDPRTTRLLHVDRQRGALVDLRIGALPDLLDAGDLVVVNDAATLPASLAGTTAGGAPVEVRLAGQAADGSWRAAIFGAGDWTTPTERRPPPPAVREGATLRLGDLRATVTRVDSPRVVRLAFDRSGAALWAALYRAGKPVQYAYMRAPLALWHVQTPFASRPWASEAPSAGFALTWELVTELRRRGVAIATLTHAAGLSSIGDDAADALLPLSEAYDVPAETARAVASTRARGGRVVAVGTTVVRALESAGPSGGRGTTDLVLGPDTPLRAATGILTGVHEPETSHFALLAAFAPRALLARAHAEAEALGYLGHEHGDAMLLL
jgi:S-adenosylmethionine:tRNA ribosyltransferase-isomerase